MAGLTDRQEKFCQKFIETCNASEAYRYGYNASNMKPATIHKRASELLSNGAVAGRLAELRGGIQKRHNVTVDSLIAELEEARQVAIEAGAPAAMVSATMGKAKITGLDKKVIEHQGIEQLVIVTTDDGDD